MQKAFKMVKVTIHIVCLACASHAFEVAFETSKEVVVDVVHEGFEDVVFVKPLEKMFFRNH